MFAYKPNFIPSSIVIVGAGGTGSRLIGPLTQLVRTCLNKFNPQAWMQNLPIFLIDGDKVEEKNLSRQCFIPKDVGNFKSVVLASRYSNAYGIPIYPSANFLLPGRTPDFMGKPDSVPFSFRNSVVILAVDSAEARRKILRVITTGPNIGLSAADPENRNCFIIDAGNEDNFGQVKFFTMDVLSDYSDTIGVLRRKSPKSFPNVCELPFLLFDPEYYENLGESASEKSCVDLPQTLAINNMMAAILLSVLQNFLYLKPMTYNCVRYGLDGSMSTDYNTPKSCLTKNVYNKAFNQLGGAISGCRVHNTALLEKGIVDAIKVYTKAGLRVDKDGELVAIEMLPASLPPAAPSTLEGTGGTAKKPRASKKPIPPEVEVRVDVDDVEDIEAVNPFLDIPELVRVTEMTSVAPAEIPPLERVRTT